jgi:hypothetical protein
MTTSVYNTVRSPLSPLFPTGEITSLPQATFNLPLSWADTCFTSRVGEWDQGLPARLMAGVPASGGGFYANRSRLEA